MTLILARNALVEQSKTADFAAFCKTGTSSLRIHQRFRAPIWEALVFSFAWFYWRRLYLIGSLMLMPPVLIVDLDIQGRWPPALNATLVVGLLFIPPFMARRLYATAFVQRCNRADRLGLSPAERHAYLASAGGTSWLGGLLAGALWISFAMVLLRSFLPHFRGAFPS